MNTKYNISELINKKVKNLSYDEIDIICQQYQQNKNKDVDQSLLNNNPFQTKKKIYPFFNIKNYEELKNKNIDLKLDKSKISQSQLKDKDKDEYEDEKSYISESEMFEDEKLEISKDEKSEMFEDEKSEMSGSEMSELDVEKDINRFNDVIINDKIVLSKMEILNGKRVEELTDEELLLICKKLSERIDPKRLKFIKLYEKSRKNAYIWAVNNKYIPKYEDINFEEDSKNGYLYIPNLLRGKKEKYKDAFLTNTIGMYTTDIVYNLTNILFDPIVKNGELYIIVSENNKEKVDIEEIKKLDFELIENLKFKYNQPLIPNISVEDVLIPQNIKSLSDDNDLSSDDNDLSSDDEMSLKENVKKNNKVKDKVNFYEKWINDRTFY